MSLTPLRRPRVGTRRGQVPLSRIPAGTVTTVDRAGGWPSGTSLKGVHSSRRGRLIRAVVVGVVGAALGLLVVGELYSGLLPGGTAPTAAERLPWLAHPFFTPLMVAAGSVLLLLLAERRAGRHRSE